MTYRVGALIVAGLLSLAASLHAQDFQPHPSHMAPPPQSASVPPPPPPPPPKSPGYRLPKRISGDMPEYPKMAQRYNAQDRIVVTMQVDAKGKVKEATADEGAPIFRESALRAVRKWRFEPRPGPSTVKFLIPFTLTGPDENPEDHEIRPMLFAPTEPAQVPGKLTFGYAYVRLLIDSKGNVVGSLTMGDHPAEFAKTREAIVSTLKFAPRVEEDGIRRPHTLNSFLVDYANDGKIRVQQRSGK